MNTKMTFAAFTMAAFLALALAPAGEALYASASANASCSYSGSITYGRTSFSASAGGSTVDVGGNWRASGAGTLSGAASDAGTYPDMSASVSSDSGWLTVPDRTYLTAEADAYAYSPVGGSLPRSADDNATCKNPNTGRTNLCDAADDSDGTIAIDDGLNLCALLPNIVEIAA